MSDLTREAQEGFDARTLVSPYLATSPCDDAWRIGRWLNDTGRTRPREVRTSRGSTYHVNEMKVRARWTPTTRGATIWTAERIS